MNGWRISVHAPSKGRDRSPRLFQDKTLPACAHPAHAVRQQGPVPGHKLPPHHTFLHGRPPSHDVLHRVHAAGAGGVQQLQASQLKGPSCSACPGAAAADVALHKVPPLLVEAAAARGTQGAQGSMLQSLVLCRTASHEGPPPSCCPSRGLGAQGPRRQQANCACWRVEPPLPPPRVGAFNPGWGPGSGR